MRRILSSALLAVLVSVLATGTAAAQADHTASSTLIQLTIDDASEAGVAGFDGVLGAVDAVPSQVVTWDQSDPDGVLSYVNGWYGGPAGNATSLAQVEEPSGTHHAETTGSGLGIALTPDASNLISFGSVHTWARCTHTPALETQQAYAADDSNQAYLFDDTTRPLQAGNQTVTTSGAALGLPNVGEATLNIAIDLIEETSPGYAHAAVKIDVQAVLRDEAGAVIYAGPLLDLTIGEVTVKCGSTNPPTPTTTTTTSPTTTSTSPTTTTTSTSPTTTTTGPTTTGPTTTGPTTTSDTPGPTLTTSSMPGGGGAGGGGGSTPGPGLANTGLPLVLPGVVGLLLVAGGAWLLRTRRGRGSVH